MLGLLLLIAFLTTPASPPSLAVLVPSLPQSLNSPSLPLNSTAAAASAQPPECPQPPPRRPVRHADISHANLDGRFRHPAYVSNLTAALSAAIRMPTYTGAPDENFFELHSVLAELFPLLNRHATITPFGKSLLFTLAPLSNGPSSSSKDPKPLLLMAHLDTVPVEQASLDRWTHPPFAGAVADGFVWGRGAADTKSTVIAILAALDALLAAGFHPTRPVLVALGHDEESESTGAGAIARALLTERGADSLLLVLDEGSTIVHMFGAEYAVVSTTEKGYLDIDVQVVAPGGHSSAPPPHTSIGILAQAIVALEDNPFPPTLVLDDNDSDDPVALVAQHPVLFHLACVASQQPSTLPASEQRHLARLIAAAATHPAKLATHVDANPYLLPDAEPVLATTQAVDLVSGGSAPNSLPESAAATVNYRVATHMRANDVLTAVADTLRPVAARNRADLVVLPIAVDDAAKSLGTLPPRTAVVVSPRPGALDPAPVSPAHGPVWDAVAGTARHVLSEFTDPDADGSGGVGGAPGSYVVPAVLVGNTDTHHHWALTQHIHRFTPLRTHGDEHLHAVDERVRVDSLLPAVAFYHELILTLDELDD
ncbi:hypothetical protein HK405_015412 [Cladochytrium tenue]|nr:hypothetical protein HK405_015412 [Cladochytrium tenue]